MRRSTFLGSPRREPGPADVAVVVLDAPIRRHLVNRALAQSDAASEAEAAIIVAALQDCGIDAMLTGVHTSCFRAEAPGDVSVVVRQADLQRARQTLEHLSKE